MAKNKRSFVTADIDDTMLKQAPGADPQIHAPDDRLLRDPERPKPDDPKTKIAAPKNAPGLEEHPPVMPPAGPIHLVPSTGQAIDLAKSAIENLRQARPDKAQELEPIAEALSRFQENVGVPGNAPDPNAGGERTGMFEKGDSVQVESEGKTYKGVLLEQNADGSWEFSSEEGVSLHSVPMSALGSVELDLKDGMTLPAAATLYAVSVWVDLTKGADPDSAFELLGDAVSRSPEQAKFLAKEWAVEQGYDDHYSLGRPQPWSSESKELGQVRYEFEEDYQPMEASVQAAERKFVLKPAGWKGAPMSMGPQWDLVGPADSDYASGVTLEEHEEAGPEGAITIFEERKKGVAASVKASDPLLEKVAKAVEGLPLMQMRKVLEPMFGKKNVDFEFMGGAHFTIKTGGKKLIITNKSNAEPDSGDLIVGDYAFGFMASVKAGWPIQASIEAGSKWYIGHKKGKVGKDKEAFQSPTTPTEKSHGDKYGAVTGPFKTEKGARYAEAYHGPIYQHVDEFEEAAAKGGDGTIKADREVTFTPEEAAEMEMSCTACQKPFKAGDTVFVMDAPGTPSGEVYYCSDACKKSTPAGAIKAGFEAPYALSYGLKPSLLRNAVPMKTLEDLKKGLESDERPGMNHGAVMKHVAGNGDEATWVTLAEGTTEKLLSEWDSIMAKDKAQGVKASWRTGDSKKVKASSDEAPDSDEVDGCDVRVYDNGGETIDRYTIVIENPVTKEQSWLGSNNDPFHSQGFGQHVGDEGSGNQEGEHLGKLIKFSALPEPVQKFVKQDCKAMAPTPEQMKEAGIEDDRKVKAMITKLKLLKAHLKAEPIEVFEEDQAVGEMAPCGDGCGTDADPLVETIEYLKHLFPGAEIMIASEQGVSATAGPRRRVRVAKGAPVQAILQAGNEYLAALKAYSNKQNQAMVEFLDNPMGGAALSTEEAMQLVQVLDEGVNDVVKDVVESGKFDEEDKRYITSLSDYIFESIPGVLGADLTDGIKKVLSNEKANAHLRKYVETSIEEAIKEEMPKHLTGVEAAKAKYTGKVEGGQDLGKDVQSNGDPNAAMDTDGGNPLQAMDKDSADPKREALWIRLKEQVKADAHKHFEEAKKEAGTEDVHGFLPEVDQNEMQGAVETAMKEEGLPHGSTEAENGGRMLLEIYNTELGALMGKQDIGAKLKADAMEKQIFKSKGVEITEKNGESMYIPYPEKGMTPDKVVAYLGLDAAEVEKVEEIDGWFGRFSMPGYLDDTDWVFDEDKAACEVELECLYGTDDDLNEEGLESALKAAKEKKAKLKAQEKPTGRKTIQGQYVIYVDHMSNDSEADNLGAANRLAEHLQKLFPHVDVVVKKGVSGVGFGWQGFDEDGIGEEMDLAAEHFDYWAPAVEASVFDKTPTIEIGNGWTLRRKEKKEEGEKPKGEAKPKEAVDKEKGEELDKRMDEKKIPKEMMASLKASLLAEEPKGEKKAEGGVHKKLVDAGVKVHKGSGTHYPDLYVEDTPEARKVIEDHNKGSEYPVKFSQFKSDHPEDKGKAMLDIPFMWEWEPKASGTQVEGGIQAAKGPEIEVVDADGKVVETLPDAFGEDLEAVKKLFLKLYPDAKKKEGEGKGKDGEGKEGAGKPKKDEPKLEDKNLALPNIEVTKDEEAQLKSVQEEAERRILGVRAMVNDMVTFGMITAAQKDVETHLMAGLGLQASQEAALKDAIVRQFDTLKRMPTDALAAIRIGMEPSIKAAQASKPTLKASLDGMEMVDGLRLRAEPGLPSEKVLKGFGPGKVMGHDISDVLGAFGPR